MRYLALMGVMVTFIIPTVTAAQSDVPSPSAGSGCITVTSRAFYKRVIRQDYQRPQIPWRERVYIHQLYECLPSDHARSWAKRVEKRYAKERRLRRAMTNYVVSGGTSAFGDGTGDGDSRTADGGNTTRPCIAIRDTSSLGAWFLVSVRGHKAILLHCDSGPYVAGRDIDITGAGVQALGMSPSNYGNYYGEARLLRFLP